MKYYSEKTDSEKAVLPETGTAPKGAGTPVSEGGDRHTRMGARIAAFFGALMLLLGITGFWLKSAEQPVTATVTAVGEVTSRTVRKRHGSSRTVTTCPMTIRFEEEGITREETVTFRLRSVWDVPKAGITAQVTKNPFGVYVAWPDNDLENWSLFLTILGCLVLPFALFILRAMSRAEREAILHGTDQSRAEDTPPVPRSDQVTERVTLQPDGLYRWYGNMDNDYYRDQQYGGVKLLICCLLAVMMILGAALRSWEFLLITLAVFSFVVLLTLLIIKLSIRGEGVTRERYTMSDTWVEAGTGKAASFFTFSRARQVTFTPRFVELRGRIKILRVYVPLEDMPFVREYIRSRLLPGTDVTEP